LDRGFSGWIAAKANTQGDFSTSSQLKRDLTRRVNRQVRVE
jgi:hypothetical protein